MLSCSCNYDDYEYWVNPDDDFSTLNTKRSRKCESCREKISVGKTVLRFECFRVPKCEYEENRFGDEVPLADKFLCESCGEIHLNLTAAGYCMVLGHDHRDDMREYREMVKFSKEERKMKRAEETRLAANVRLYESPKKKRPLTCSERARGQNQK